MRPANRIVSSGVRRANRNRQKKMRLRVCGCPRLNAWDCAEVQAGIELASSFGVYECTCACHCDGEAEQ